MYLAGCKYTDHEFVCPICRTILNLVSSTRNRAIRVARPLGYGMHHVTVQLQHRLSILSARTENFSRPEFSVLNHSSVSILMDLIGVVVIHYVIRTRYNQQSKKWKKNQ